jgi:hypothetical protein
MIMRSMIQEIEQFGEQRSSILPFATEEDIIDKLTLTT